MEGQLPETITGNRHRGRKPNSGSRDKRDQLPEADFRYRHRGRRIAQFAAWISRLPEDVARLPRVVVPGVAHHVVQRGNRRQRTFFREFDFELYRQLLADECRRARVSIWAYCQMPNHVHLILVPEDPSGLRLALGRAHRKYTRRINWREGWTGCLWQGRFASFPMAEAHLRAAARYVLRNPVRAGLVERAESWPHSSASAHASGRSDGVVDLTGLSDRVDDWPKFLDDDVTWREWNGFRRHAGSGRPLGDERFQERVEVFAGRSLNPWPGIREPLARDQATPANVSFA